MIKLYNTLTKQHEEFKPSNPDHVNMYTCGPTVYNYAHIGNLRSYILADFLYRTLLSDGYMVNWVMNITDIDDKTIKGTIEKYGKEATVENLREYTGVFMDAFLKDLDEVNVARKDINFIRVTDVIPQIQDFIAELIQKGYAYKAEDGSTYFSIEKYQKEFGDYGALVGEKFLEGKKIGARVKVDEYEKDNLSDFALWKAWDEADAHIYWDHPLLGKGRPGWHIECSVINRVAFAGEPTDIHTGGVDLMFPHHTNEIAQSQPIYKPFTCHWAHTEHLLVEGRKMAKSAHNFYVLSDLKAKTPLAGPALRYLYLQGHYRTQQNFTWESFAAAHSALEKLRQFASQESPREVGVAGFEDAFKAALENDLNTAEALAEAWKLVGLGEMPLEPRLTSLSRFDRVLGLNLSEPEAEEEVPDEVSELVEKRAKARVEKDFKASDDLRKEIEDLGYEIMDTPEGQKVKKKLII